MVTACPPGPPLLRSLIPPLPLPLTRTAERGSGSGRGTGSGSLPPLRRRSLFIGGDAPTCSCPCRINGCTRGDATRPTPVGFLFGPSLSFLRPDKNPAGGWRCHASQSQHGAPLARHHEMPTAHVLLCLDSLKSSNQCHCPCRSLVGLRITTFNVLNSIISTRLFLYTYIDFNGILSFGPSRLFSEREMFEPTTALLISHGLMGGVNCWIE
jgi:hypothetical protein